ncbi:hypothetical protein OIU79_023581 [Salix purpurea]|uniref:Uncharacterized protein n=1 Tax=Salix purpurea TaxID=77065 RepID=A0A9Q0W9G9_SALPP|nr:hypothetical protein OIU79_023581 [Salix purpurea]
MAGYDYLNRGYTGYNPPGSDDYERKTGYVPDHVCRPVIIGADGRKRPLISYGHDQNADHYVTNTERYVEQHDHSSMEPDRHGPRLSEESYGAENRLRRPLVSANGRPQIVEEFITGVQTEAGRPKGATWDASSRRPTPKPTGYDGGYTDGYDEHNGFNNDLTNPRGDARRNDSYYDDYYRKQGSNMEPTMNTGGGRARPSQSSLAAPPNGSLSGATNDIRAAVGLLREVAKPRVSTSPRTQYTEPTYTNTIDSKEASRRYGNFNFSSRPHARDDGYTSTIDSREALRKYRGSAV